MAFNNISALNLTVGNKSASPVEQSDVRPNGAKTPITNIQQRYDYATAEDTNGKKKIWVCMDVYGCVLLWSSH